MRDESKLLRILAAKHKVDLEELGIQFLELMILGIDKRKEDDPPFQNRLRFMLNRSKLKDQRRTETKRILGALFSRRKRWKRVKALTKVRRREQAKESVKTFTTVSMRTGQAQWEF